MTTVLFHPDGEFAEHLPDEVLRRIAPAFRYIVIDKASGDRLVQAQYAKLLELHAPEVILQSHKFNFGKAVFVTLAEDPDSRVKIRFLLQPYSGISIEYDSDAHRDRCRLLVEELARLLGYEMEE
jgi:hypothetical protein